MDRPQFLTKIIEWLRAGYPDGVPQDDYIPLVALLRRQLSEEEIQQVADVLVDGAGPEPISKIDVGVMISKITNELPHEDDIDRVRHHLETAGWPFDDAPLAAETDPPPTATESSPTATENPPTAPKDPPTAPKDPPTATENPPTAPENPPPATDDTDGDEP